MIRITLDPGHTQNYNEYPPKRGFYEGTQMWKLANYLKAELEKYGFIVKTTRPNLADNPSLAQRGQIAAGDDLIISLHSNATADIKDTQTTGTVIFYTLSTPHIKTLADKLGNKIASLMGHHYRGSMTKESTTMKGYDYYGVLRYAIINKCKAGLLIEHGFHTNPKDAAFLTVDNNLKKLAEEEAKIIYEYYKGGINMNYLESDIILMKGQKSELVRQLQKDLIALGYSLAPYGADGDFGTVTENAVRKFQADNKLTVDGKVGPQTKKKIAELLAAKAKAETETAYVKEIQALRNELNSLKTIVNNFETILKSLEEKINKK